MRFFRVGFLEKAFLTKSLKKEDNYVELNSYLCLLSSRLNATLRCEVIALTL